MSTTTPSCVNDNNDRYERIQVTLIVLACISGVLALVSMIIYLKRKYNNRILPINYYDSAYRNNIIGNLCCCPEDSISVTETTQKYINFIDNVNTNIDNMLLSIDLREFNLLEETQSRNNIECGICKKNIKRDDLSIKLRCNHTFSKKCIMNWFKIGNNHCPICRNIIIN
jgi:hypothetical protein